MILDWINALYHFFTSKAGLEFLALFLILDGLILEIIGVFVLLSPDYERIRARVISWIDIPRGNSLHNLREWLNQEKDNLRLDGSFDTEGDWRTLSFSDAEDKSLMEYVLFPEERERTTIINAGLIATENDPRMGEIHLRVDTEEHSRVTFTDDRFDRLHQQAVTRSFYRLGGWPIIIGFMIMFLATLLQIGAFTVS